MPRILGQRSGTTQGLCSQGATRRTETYPFRNVGRLGLHMPAESGQLHERWISAGEGNRPWPPPGSCSAREHRLAGPPTLPWSERNDRAIDAVVARIADPNESKHGDVIVCATTACLRARLRTAPIRSRERQRADAQLLMTFCLTTRR